MDGKEIPLWSGELIDEAVQGFLETLSAKEVKLTVTDTLRLLDLRKQLTRDELREVRVRWVESNPAPLAINS